MEPWTRRFFAAVLIGAVLLTGMQVAGWLPATQAQGPELVSAAVSGALPAMDPASAAWGDAAPLQVPLSAQLVILPTRATPFTDSLEVRSLNNETHIAVRLSWADPVKDIYTTRQGQFRDAVAIQVAPRAGTPPLCMGAAGGGTHILQWKADWQADIEEGFHDLQDEFPNFWVDYYPYLMGQPPYTSPVNFSENARLYLVGYTVGNPFSQPVKVTAVEDAVAEGFSTITTQRQLDAIGRGVWADGRWSVVITWPKDSGDGQDVPIGENVLAFAVWDGASGDVGSRKSITGWVNLQVEAPRGPVELVLGVLLVLLVAVALVTLRSFRRQRKEREEKEREDEVILSGGEAKPVRARPPQTKTGGKLP